MDLFLYELWDFDRNAEDGEDEDEESEHYNSNEAAHLEMVRIKDVLPLVNGFYECSNILSVYPYSEIGKFGNGGHAIRDDGSYVTKDLEYGLFLPYQDKAFAKKVVHDALVEMECPIAANAVLDSDAYSHRSMNIYNWTRASTAYAKKCDKALSERIAKGLSIIKCDAEDCIKWKDGKCEEDTAQAGVCSGYFKYSMCPKYQNEFWGLFITTKDGMKYRKKYYGRCFEIKGMVFYKVDDIRSHAIEKAQFCEEYSGLWIDWKDMQKIITSDEKLCARIKELFKNSIAVMSLPILENAKR